MDRKHIKKCTGSGAMGENANQDHEEMALHSSKNGYHQRDKDDKSWEGRAGKRTLPGTMWVGTHECTYSARRYEIPLKILSLFVAVLFIAQNGDHLSAQLLVNTHTCAAYTQHDFFSHLKGWNPIINNDMGGTEDHCSKLNKSGW